MVECDLVQEFPPVDYELPITSPDVFILDHSRSTCLQGGECSSQLEFSTSFGDSEQSSIITDNSHCHLHRVSQYRSRKKIAFNIDNMLQQVSKSDK